MLGGSLSLVRKIEKVHPVNGRRIVAMTFDDGPNSDTPNPDTKKSGAGVTECILSTLKKYNSKGTFNVIGTTERNYPDVIGEVGTKDWSGKVHDHYPGFLKDHLGGVKNNLTTTKRIIDEGHELSNHTYSHILAGPCPYYTERFYHKSFSDLLEDIYALHNLVKERFNYEIKLGRPPHYVDNCIDMGLTVFDAYCLMGYNYLGSSFNGGGWRESRGDYKKDTQVMAGRIKRTLEKDPNSLNGQIIFQKDGCNMSLQTPVIDALSEQLRILKDHDYEVVVVSELLELSPYQDVSYDDPGFNDIVSLTKTGHAVCGQDNFFRPDDAVTWIDLITMLTPSEKIRNYYRDRLAEGSNKERQPLEISPIVLDFMNRNFASHLGPCQLTESITSESFEKFLNKTHYNIDWTNKGKIPKKRDLCGALTELILKGILG